jgi:hypothetical protein
MTENAGLRAVVSKAQIIDELEDSLPGWVKRSGAPKWYPPFVHVLKARAGGAPTAPTLYMVKSLG